MIHRKPRQLYKQFIAAIALLLSACSGDSTVSSQPLLDRINVSIEGTVFDAINSEPIRDAIVRTDPPTESVVTNTEGNYSLTDSVNGEGTFQVFVSHQAYETAQTTIAAASGSTSQVDFALQSNMVGLNASTLFLQFPQDTSRQTLLLSSNIQNTGYSILVTDPWVSVDIPQGQIVNRETVPITVTIDRDQINGSFPASSRIVINSDNGTRELVITLQITASIPDNDVNSRQLDCRQTDVLRFGLNNPDAPLLQFPESLVLPVGTGSRFISVTNPFLVDSFVLQELGTITLEHVAGGPSNTTLEIFELALDETINTLATNTGISAENKRASIEWALTPGIYCYFLSGTDENFTQPEQLQVDFTFTAPQ